MAEETKEQPKEQAQPAPGPAPAPAPGPAPAPAPQPAPAPAPQPAPAPKPAVDYAALVEACWQHWFPNSAVSRDTATWNYAYQAKEDLKVRLSK